MSEVYEFNPDSVNFRKMTPTDIDLHKNGYYTYIDDKIEVRTNEKSEVEKMDDNVKVYIDQRIDNLEKSLDQKFEFQQHIFSEKIDHLNTKTEKIISEKFATFKEENDKNRKEDRKFLISTGIAIAAVAVGILGFVF
ncbi:MULTISPECIES: hypothetical protein [Clostridia]|uniref:hypothetical protein n=1 Tax=Clostridia TaxID=186801 RepID=UPI000EA158FE|nr:MULTISPECIES: hypothetical protein [Clostridia]NBJ71354.1 hypothetical protein [Roseburia sp. 1XD42-34]RKI74035.1 hypothetical protein D7V87_19595 [Clostridium sp. 1xD42-85]